MKRVRVPFTFTVVLASGISSGCGSATEGRGSTPSRDASSSPANDASASASSTPLPASMKGYELYAWDEAGELRFMLITGTNRQKTVEEIRVPNAMVESGEWIAISGTGATALEALLARVPDETPVTLQKLDGLPELGSASRTAVERALARIQL